MRWGYVVQDKWPSFGVQRRVDLQKVYCSDIDWDFVIVLQGLVGISDNYKVWNSM